eukprot:COSAG01_NODE_2665_length_7288_cov_30.045208_2_plen_151_part_00
MCVRVCVCPIARGGLVPACAPTRLETVGTLGGLCSPPRAVGKVAVNGRGGPASARPQQINRSDDFDDHRSTLTGFCMVRHGDQLRCLYAYEARLQVLGSSCTDVAAACKSIAALYSSTTPYPAGLSRNGYFFNNRYKTNSRASYSYRHVQ